MNRCFSMQLLLRRRPRSRCLPAAPAFSTAPEELNDRAFPQVDRVARLNSPTKDGEGSDFRLLKSKFDTSATPSVIPRNHNDPGGGRGEWWSEKVQQV